MEVGSAWRWMRRERKGRSVMALAKLFLLAQSQSDAICSRLTSEQTEMIVRVRKLLSDEEESSVDW